MIGVSNPPGENIAISPRNSIEQQIFGFARSMDNFMYLVGDIRTRECAIVDGCWDPHGIARYAEKNTNMEQLERMGEDWRKFFLGSNFHKVADLIVLSTFMQVLPRSE